MIRAYQVWKKIALFIGDINSTILFSILYFILFVPIGIIVNLFSDFLESKKSASWKKYNYPADSLEDLKEQ